MQVDGAVARALLAALAPAGLEAALAAAERLEADREGALTQWQLAAERARYEAQRAERRYRAVDAENRLVARGLESRYLSAGTDTAWPARAGVVIPSHYPPRCASASQREVEARQLGGALPHTFIQEPKTR